MPCLRYPLADPENCENVLPLKIMLHERNCRRAKKSVSQRASTGQQRQAVQQVFAFAILDLLSVKAFNLTSSMGRHTYMHADTHTHMQLRYIRCYIGLQLIINGCPDKVM